MTHQLKISHQNGFPVVLQIQTELLLPMTLFATLVILQSFFSIYYLLTEYLVFKDMKNNLLNALVPFNCFLPTT